MNRLKLSSWASGLITAVVLGNAGIAQAATFTANITGDQVVPGTGSTATGIASFWLNEAETQLAYTMSFQGVDLKASDPNDSKLLTDFTSAFKTGGLHVQVHTNRFDASTGFPGELRGQILPVNVSPSAKTPEPFGVFGLTLAVGTAAIALRRPAKS